MECRTKQHGVTGWRAARPNVRVGALLVLVAGLGGCNGEGQPPSIGFAYARYGDVSVRVAEDEAATWASSGAPISVRIVRPQNAAETVESAVLTAIELVEDEAVLAVVGHSDSRGSVAAKPVYRDGGVVQLSPEATSSLFDTGTGWARSLSPPDSVYAHGLATVAVDTFMSRRVSMIYVGDEYGASLASRVAEAVGRRGVPITHRASFARDGDIAASIASWVPDPPADLVIVIARDADAGRIVREVHRRAPASRFLLSDAAQLGPRFYNAAGDAADSAYTLALWDTRSTDSVSIAFIRRFRRIANAEPQPRHALRHDALMLMLTAIRNGARTRDDVRQYLNDLGSKTPPYVGVTGRIPRDAGWFGTLIAARDQNE